MPISPIGIPFLAHRFHIIKCATEIDALILPSGGSELTEEKKEAGTDGACRRHDFDSFTLSLTFVLYRDLDKGAIARSGGNIGETKLKLNLAVGFSMCCGNCYK